MALQDCRWFKEGAAARAEGKPVESCEYGGGSPKAILWLEGWNRGLVLTGAITANVAVVVPPAALALQPDDDNSAASVVAKIEAATALLKRDPDDLPEIGIDS